MKNNKKNYCYAIITIILLILLLLGLFSHFAAKWYSKVFGDVGFDSIIYTLFSGTDGVNKDLVNNYIKDGVIASLIAFVIIAFVLFFKSKKRIVLSFFNKFKISIFPLKRSVAVILCSVITVLCFASAVFKTDFAQYASLYMQKSNIFQDYYKDPRTTEIIFPEEKQNLIYIYLESMETTYFSKGEGGALDDNVIPELYKLAEENLNFSHNNTVGGFKTANGTSWTAGAMVSQTAGIPLKIPSNFSDNTYGESSFLPGAYTLTNILNDNGYYQALMVGSDSSFANRNVYYSQHGVDEIFDLYTAYQDGVVADGYSVWWGLEDKYLFSYAQEKLSEISQKPEPFAFTLLTVDTHHVDGYVCDLCQSEHLEQYENVLSCASRQVYDFVRWIQSQDFYKNTSIVISGDHLTMDNAYITRNVDEGYERHVYNCFINAAATAVNTNNRGFCAVDMFPTTLAAIGCEIKGNRLGLGTNMFSSTQTLIEEIGYENFNNELIKNSSYYMKNFLLN